MPDLAHRRIEGLTVWRALLMLGGLLLHATVGREDYWPFAIVNIVSGSFRMGAFFIISGMLTGMAMVRRGAAAREWLQKRMLALAIPTLFGIAILCPTIRLLLAGMDGNQEPAFSFYHLWFMVALLDYTALTWLLCRFEPMGRHRPRWDHFSISQPVLLTATGAVSFLLMLATSATIADWSGDGATLLRQAPLVIGYAPMFLLGLLCGRFPPLRMALTSDWRFPVAIIALIGVCHVGWHAGWISSTEPGARELLLHASAAWCPAAVTALIVRSALGIRSVPPPLQHLSEASLTIYLAHYPLILAIRALIAPLGFGPWIALAVMVVGGGSLSYFVHALMVRRSHTLSLLVNGRSRLSA